MTNKENDTSVKEETPDKKETSPEKKDASSKEAPKEGKLYDGGAIPK